jgi:hypothetical protein
MTPEPEAANEFPGKEIPKKDNDDDETKKIPSKLTVSQFLNRSPQKSAIDGLVRSLYSSEVMSFEEWAKKIDALLKKKTL